MSVLAVSGRPHEANARRHRFTDDIVTTSSPAAHRHVPLRPEPVSRMPIGCSRAIRFHLDYDPASSSPLPLTALLARHASSTAFFLGVSLKTAVGELQQIVTPAGIDSDR
jgi:hypothetical protein